MRGSFSSTGSPLNKLVSSAPASFVFNFFGNAVFPLLVGRGGGRKEVACARAGKVKRLFESRWFESFSSCGGAEMMSLFRSAMEEQRRSVFGNPTMAV